MIFSSHTGANDIYRAQMKVYYIVLGTFLIIFDNLTKNDQE